MPIIKPPPPVEHLKNQCSEIKKDDSEKCVCNENTKNEKRNPFSDLFGDFFNNFEIDDLIIIGIIPLLMYEGCDDWLTLGLLAAVLLF